MNGVSVVIPNFNGIGYLKACLDSLREQTMKDFEILMVDNGSRDDSIAFVTANYPEVTIVPLKKNYGFCKAVNEGIRFASAPYVILLNNDTKVDKQYVKKLYEGIKKRPGCFSCAPMMIQMHAIDRIDDAGDFYCALGWAFSRGKDQPITNYQKEERIFAASGGASIYRREVFEKIGFFDERHFAYLEDIDIGYRSRIFGYENWYLPDAIVYHVGSGTSGSRYNEFKIQYSSRNNVYLIYKNMPILQILLNLPLLLPGFLVKFFFFTSKGYGKEYAKGLWKGILMSKKENKVRFQKRYLWNYCKIQLELWQNIYKKIKKS